MSALDTFMEKIRQDEELMDRVEDCDSFEELYEIAKEYGVSGEELKAALDQMDSVTLPGEF